MRPKNNYKNFIKLGMGGITLPFGADFNYQKANTSPRTIPNPLQKFGFGGLLSAVSPLVSKIPGIGTVAAPLLGIAGSAIEAQEQARAAKRMPTAEMNTNPYGYAAGGEIEQMQAQQQMQQVEGDGMNPISNQSYEVQGDPNQMDSEQVNYKGQNIKLDNNEMVDTVRDMVFSDKMFDPRTGKSFASTAKKLERNIHKSDKPTVIDQVTKAMLEKQKEGVFKVQEQIATMLGQRNQDGSTVQQGMAMGGRVNRYATAGYLGDPTKKYFTPPLPPEGPIPQVGDMTVPQVEAGYTGPDVEITAQRGTPPVTGWKSISSYNNPNYQKGSNIYNPKIPYTPTEGAKEYYRAYNKFAAANPSEGLNTSKTFEDFKYGKNHAAAQPIVDAVIGQEKTHAQGIMNPIPTKNLLSSVTSQTAKPPKPDFLKPSITPSTSKPKNPNAFTTGDWIQTGGLAAQGLMALLNKPQKQQLYQNTAPISQASFDPSRALMENQYAANAARANIGNTYSSAGAQAGYQNLAANQMKQNATTITQYDTMNEEARVNYEQRLGQRQSENNQLRLQTDDINMANKANRRNEIRNFIESGVNFGKGLSDRSTNLKAAKYIAGSDPQMYKYVQAGLSEQEALLKVQEEKKTKTSKLFKYGGKIKMNKRYGN